MSTVALENLVKSFGSVRAVDDVTLHIREGEFFSLLGPSGCGKSTTLRMLAGFEDLSSGAIKLDGQDVASLPPEKRDIGFVFQNYAIFPHMNVFDNIAFGLKLRKYPEADIKEKVNAALDQVGMTGLEGRMQSEMSGGQQQRVALARVLVTKPKILLLDEPLSALDKNLREEMKFWIKDLQSNLGITTIYVTHDQSEALTLSDRIAVMKGGKVAQVGPPQDIYERPTSHFVAKFIGDSSLLEGHIGEIKDGKMDFIVGDVKFQAIAHHRLKSGQSASMVLRPEHILAGSSSDDTDGWNIARVTAHSVTYQGSSQRYSFEFQGQNITSEIANRADMPVITPGEEVTIMWQIAGTWVLPEGS